MLDTRFRYRPVRFSHPDPRIVVIDIDQRAQEVLGRWPFSRTNFAKALDVVRDQGAKVVGFDVTFSKPDQSAAPLRALWAEPEAREKRREAVDRRLSREVQRLAASYDADRQFTTSIRRFGPVVLGNYFLFTDADLRGIEASTLDLCQPDCLLCLSASPSAPSCFSKAGKTPDAGRVRHCQSSAPGRRSQP